MRVKKFVARTLPEALVQAKAELGPDAVILQTSEMTVGGLFGLFGRKMIQVMAAVDEPSMPVRGSGVQRFGHADRNGAVRTGWAVRSPAAEQARAAPPSRNGCPAGAGEPFAPAHPPAMQRTIQQAAAAQGGPPEPADLAQVREDVAVMKAMVGRLVEQIARSNGAQGLDPELSGLLERLLEGGVEEQEAWSLVSRVRDGVQKRGGSLTATTDEARRILEADLRDVRPIQSGSRLVVLVGPTGVGKTTTLAKLAARFALEERKRVGLMTADTYRIAAVEQLRTYSEILGLPLEVIYDPSEVGQALDRLSGRDLILVDMAGRSPRNTAHMAELKAFLDALTSAEIYLVMSLTSGHRDAVTIAESYLPLQFDRFLFTKWDETVSPGLIYTMVRKYGRPLSYITTGQSVPDDIEEADPTKIARAILGD